MPAIDVAVQPQILRGSTATLTAQFYADGEPTDPGAVTLGIVDAAGAVIVAALTAMSGTGTAARTYALTGTHTALLGRWTVTFTTADVGTLTAAVEVVGANLFSLADARAWDNAALANTTIYPQAQIESMRAQILDEFEIICGIAFVPRYERVVMDGVDAARMLLFKENGDPALRVSAVRSVEYRTSGTTTWTAFTADELADVFTGVVGSLYRETLGTFNYGRQSIRVAFEHGYTAPPLPIRQAALIVCRYLLVPSNLNSRALQENSQYGPIQLATAGRYGDHYGIPAVDSVLDRYCERIPAVA